MGGGVFLQKCFFNKPAPLLLDVKSVLSSLNNNMLSVSGFGVIKLDLKTKSENGLVSRIDDQSGHVTLQLA